MKVLLLSTNRMRQIMPPMPLGLLYLAGSLDRERHQVRILDLMFTRSPLEEVEGAVKSYRPDLIGVSVRNLDNQSLQGTEYALPAVREVIQACRQSSEARIVVGGMAFSTLPGPVFDFLKPDLGIVGEGERVFPELVDRLEAGAPVEELPGLVFRGGDGRVHVDLPQRGDLSDLPFPRLEPLDYRRYLKGGLLGGMANVLVKLGCPFRCAYCDGPRLMGESFRMRPPPAVGEELELLSRKYGIRDLFFTDPVFNVPLEPAKAICQEILARRLRLRWVCTFHPAEFDEELIQLIKRAGCRFVVLSPDTGSERMLESLQKGYGLDRVKLLCDLLEKVGLDYVLEILFGGPGENAETVAETFAFLERVHPTIINFSSGMRILPGTRLAQVAQQEGIIAAEEELMEPTFYLSPPIRGWIDRRILRERVRHLSWQIRPLRFLASSWLARWRA